MSVTFSCRDCQRSTEVEMVRCSRCVARVEKPRYAARLLIAFSIACCACVALVHDDGWIGLTLFVNAILTVVLL